MYSKKIEILNKTGLHARPAAEFVAAAGKFKSKITINKLDDEGSCVKSGMAKSVISLMTLALSKGSKIELCADGPDEAEAVNTLASLIESGFGEL